jgi:hypothetical protein
MSFRSREAGEESALFSGAASKSRFLAEFTLSPFASLRAVRSGMANGLGMTAPNPFFISLLNLKLLTPEF